ncbi:recombinase family protein, partial [Actinopolymorpha pittospori]
MNLKEWAASQGVSYATALRWYKAGKLPVPAYQAGRLIVIGEPGVAAGRAVAVYARVSSSDQSADLDRQVAWVSAWATTNGYQVAKIVTEVGSALDGKRPKFLALLRDPS